MRTYGRVTDPVTKAKRWVVVETAPDGSNDYVYITTLCQVLLLNLNESPFYAQWGLPAKEAVIQQVAPDFYVSRIQQFFSQYFASLIIWRVPGIVPVYNVNIVTNQGVKIAVNIPI